MPNKRSTAIWKKGKLYINNHTYQLKTKPTLPNKINSTEAWDRCQSCQNIQSLKICVRNINGLNPDDIVDLQSHIEKYDLAKICETWLKETINYTNIIGESTCKCFNKPRLVQTKKLKELLKDF